MATNRNFQEKRAEFKAVIQCPLLPEDAPKVIAYIATADAVQEMFEILVDTGYEVTFIKQKKSPLYSVCLKGVSQDCLNAGKWLYGNGDTLHLAFCSAFYKHFEIYSGGEWTPQTSGGTMGVS